jgi:hypothetical protein
MSKKSLADMMGGYEFEDATTPAQPSPRPAHMDIGQAKMPYDLRAEMREILNRPTEEVKKPQLPGDQPRVYAEGSPLARGIALDASKASAANAETPEHAATRRYNAALAGSQNAVPFFPHVRGAVAGAGALLKGEDFTPAYKAETVHAAKQLEEASAGDPVAAAMGAAPIMVAAPGGVTAKTGLGRVGGAAGLGAAYGADAADKQALTTQQRSATMGEMLGPALVGAGIGTAGGLAGEAIRPIVRGAPAREDKAFIREVTRTEGGEGASAMLAKNKEGIAKDFEDVVRQRKDPVVRAAVKLPEGQGIPIIQSKISPYAEENAEMYKAMEKGLVSGKKHAGQMTQDRLVSLLDEAKDKVSPEAADRIEAIKQDLTKHWVPRAWNGEQVIPLKRMREWLTSVQDSAARVPGSLNATSSFKSLNDATAQATKIFNDHLDAAGIPALAEKIRANNEEISALSRIRDAMVVKAKKEKLQAMGLGSVLEDQQRQMERTAALWSAMEGKPVAAAAILAKPYAEKGAARTYRWLNREVLEPMELAAQKGATKAELARFAIERGIPQGFANSYAAKMANKAANVQQPLTAKKPTIPAGPPVARDILGEWTGK